MEGNRNPLVVLLHTDTKVGFVKQIVLTFCRALRLGRIVAGLHGCTHNTQLVASSLPAHPRWPAACWQLFTKPSKRVCTGFNEVTLLLIRFVRPGVGWLVATGKPEGQHGLWDHGTFWKVPMPTSVGCQVPSGFHLIGIEDH